MPLMVDVSLLSRYFLGDRNDASTLVSSNDSNCFFARFLFLNPDTLPRRRHGDFETALCIGR